MGLTFRCGSGRHLCGRSFISLPAAFTRSKAANNSGQWRSLGYRWKAVFGREQERSRTFPAPEAPAENFTIENSWIALGSSPGSTGKTWQLSLPSCREKRSRAAHPSCYSSAEKATLFLLPGVRVICPERERSPSGLFILTHYTVRREKWMLLRHS